MGAGKSTVGPLVADRLGWDFLDMDEHLEERLGMSVAEYFRAHGEEAFREEERRWRSSSSRVSVSSSRRAAGPSRTTTPGAC